MLKQLATRVPGIAPFVAKCYGRTPAEVFYHMKCGERRTILWETGVYQRDALGPVLFCMLLGTRLAKTRERFEPLGVEPFAYMDDVFLAFLDLTAAAVEPVPFLKHKPMDMGVLVNETKTVALPSPEPPLRRKRWTSSWASASASSIETGRW